MANKTSSFKYIYSLVFQNGGDQSKIDKKLLKTPIKCYVKESHPHFLVTDDYFYVPCYFTKKAVENFKRSNKVNITDLRSKVITIKDWSLELAKVKSEDVFTSYGGVELKLVVNDFDASTGGDSISLNRHPINLYRDNEMKTLINKFIWNAQTSTVASGIKSESLPDISKFSGKGNVSNGVVNFAKGESFNVGFKDAKTAVMNSNDLLKADKGSGAVKAGATDKNARPKVTGGLAAKKKAIKKVDVSGIASKIAKYTPGGKSSAKQSVSRKGPRALATPGDDLSGAGTTDLKSMA